MNEHEQELRESVDAARAAEAADEQGLLFTDDVSPLPSDLGYRGPTACNAAGITYRQLDYWARTGLVEPTVRGAKGSGSQRLYSFRDILILKVIKRLLDAGISLQQIRTAVSHLRERGTDDLTRVTLMSDGASVYECTSNDEVIDLLQGGQGVFGIAIGGVWREIEGTLAELPSERTVDEAAAEAPVAGDELAARRAARSAGGGGAGPASALVDSLPLTIPRGRVSSSQAGGAEGAIPPRNLSGTRTAQARRLWSAPAPAGDVTEGEGPDPDAPGALPACPPSPTAARPASPASPTDTSARGPRTSRRCSPGSGSTPSRR